MSQDVYRDSISFYVVDEDEITKKRYLVQFTGELPKRIELSGYDEVSPSFRLNGISGNEFLKEMAERAAERGIKLESDLKREGKLEATEKHLEDMRKIVFK